MRFTQAEYEKANQVDLATYMLSRGYNLIRDGQASYRQKEHDSFVIKNNFWYWNSQGLKGYPVQFLTKVEGYSLPEAVHILANSTIPVFDFKGEPPKPFILPEANTDNDRVFTYLNVRRGIDKDILNLMIKSGRIYESKQHHNCVFVGKDVKGAPRYAALRGTYNKTTYKGEVTGSDKSYPFFLPGKNGGMVFCFESAIDALSHATLAKIKGEDWTKDYRVSLGGIANVGTSDRAIAGFFRSYRNMRKICFCLDNDEAGKQALPELCKKYARIGLEVYTQLPESKDFNSDLTRLLEQESNFELDVELEA